MTSLSQPGPETLIKRRYTEHSSYYAFLFGKQSILQSLLLYFNLLYFNIDYDTCRDQAAPRPALLRSPRRGSSHPQGGAPRNRGPVPLPGPTCLPNLRRWNFQNLLEDARVPNLKPFIPTKHVFIPTKKIKIVQILKINKNR